MQSPLTKHQRFTNHSSLFTIACLATIMAVIGAFDPIYGPSGCARHAEVARMLLKVNPRLRPGNSARANVVRRATSLRGCDDVNRLIANSS